MKFSEWRSHFHAFFFKDYNKYVIVRCVGFIITIVVSKDMIATLGETTGTWALRSIKEKMEADPTGQRILT